MRGTEQDKTDGTQAERFHPIYGPGALNWLIEGVLPLVGVALIEAEDRDTAEMVAADIGTCVAEGIQWAAREALAEAPTLIYQDDGVWVYAEDLPARISPDAPEPGPALRLDLAKVRLPEQLYSQGAADSRTLAHAAQSVIPMFALAVEMERGAAILAVRMTQEIASNPGALAALTDIAGRLNCLALLIAGTADLSASDMRTLREAANPVLRVTREGEGGEIVRVSGDGSGGPWGYDIQVVHAGGETIEGVNEVWELPRNAH